MTYSSLLRPLALVSALALVPTTALAQRGGGRSHSGGGSRSSGGAVRGGSVRGGSIRGGVAVRGGSIRGGGAVVSGARSFGRTYPVYRGGSFTAVPRFGGSRVIGSRGFVGARSRGFSGIGSRGFGVAVVGPRYYRPYYSFRPRFSLGFGLWAGYPVTYPYYYDDYAYPYPYPVYGYGSPSYGYSTGYAMPAYPQYGSVTPSYPAEQAPNPSGGVQPGEQPTTGGVSFEITPSDAAVLVDGTYVGTVADFGARSQPLGLVAGRHHIEVRASGYQTMTFDADVTAGQVIPYQGTLQRQR
jgi:hypothetical protein